jgi:hypothetical protein
LFSAASARSTVTADAAVGTAVTRAAVSDVDTTGGPPARGAEDRPRSWDPGLKLEPGFHSAALQVPAPTGALVTVRAYMLDTPALRVVMYR